MKIAFIGEHNAVPPIATLDLIRTSFAGAVWLVTDCTAHTDTLARRYAQAHGIAVEVIRAQPDSTGRHSGIARDKALVDSADLVVAYSANRSTGRVFGAINQAHSQGKPILIFPAG